MSPSLLTATPASHCQDCHSNFVQSLGVLGAKGIQAGNGGGGSRSTLHSDGNSTFVS